MSSVIRGKLALHSRPPSGVPPTCCSRRCSGSSYGRLTLTQGRKSVRVGELLHTLRQPVRSYEKRIRDEAELTQTATTNLPT